MAKEFEDKFFEELRSGVVEAEPIKGSLHERKRILERNIAELEANVIKDPKAIENLKKELASVNKQIKKEEAEKAVESGTIIAGADIVDEVEEQSTLEEKEKIKDNQQVGTDEKNIENEERLKQLYYNSIVAYYDARLKTVRRQLSSNELISRDDEYKFEIKLENEMYKAREVYMATGNEDPYEEFRSKHAYIDRQAHEPLDRVLREKARKYREIENEIAELDKETRELNEKLQNTELTDMQRNEYESRNTEIDEKRKKLELKKAEYKDGCNCLEQQKDRENSNRALQKKRREAASKEEIKGYDYQRSKHIKAQHNASVAEKTERNNIETRIAESEAEIEKLQKQLNKVPDTDFKLRLDILEKLNKETNKLQANKDQKILMDRGYELSEAEMKAETKKSYEILEEEQEKLEKATEVTREVIEEQEEKIGEAVVTNPEVANVEERDRQASAMAATYAIVHDGPAPEKDTAIQNQMQYMAAKEVAKCVIPGLERHVKTIDDTEEGRRNAEEYLEQDAQIREADRELDRIEKDLTSI